MARLSLPLVLAAVLAVPVIGVSSAALAAPEAVDADAELAARAAALPTPSMRTRIQARAAAYRVVLQTAHQLGFDDAAVAQVAHASQGPIVVAVRAPERD